MAKNINKKTFDDATRLKLKIFGESFEEWLPVFIYDKYTDQVSVFDFFAGSGTDIENNPGSPLILLDKAKGENRKYCANAKKSIKFFFNEEQKRKSNELQQNTDVFIEQCKKDNKCSNCVYDYHILNYSFQELFNNPDLKRVFENKNIAKFVLLDQYGFSQINEDIFKQLISFPKTDFIFFISSSFINRFKEHPNTTKYIDTSKISFEDKKPNEIHRAIADYFRDLIPTEQEYYLHHFSIRKEERKGNYYGLIFGSNHTLGMEKFLKVCWKYDKLSGEANYNIDNNWEANSLFSQLGENVKKDTVSKEIKELILSGEITGNKTGLKYALINGCEPKLFTEVVQNLINRKAIEIIGKFNKQSTSIHKIKEPYQIKRINNGK
jgi:three-Cys-motif partner protein